MKVVETNLEFYLAFCNGGLKLAITLVPVQAMQPFGGFSGLCIVQLDVDSL